MLWRLVHDHEHPGQDADRTATVLAVDDQPAFLELLRDVIAATERLRAVGEAHCGEEAIELAATLVPDMILMDVRMPGIGGIKAAGQIKRQRPGTVIVMVSTTHPSELAAQIDPGVADAVIWKSELEPERLDEVWRRDRAQS